MMENTNESVQNLEEVMTQPMEKVDDSEDFYYEQPQEEMIYSTNEGTDFFNGPVVEEVGESQIEEVEVNNNVYSSMEEEAQAAGIELPNVSDMSEVEVEEKVEEVLPEVKSYDLTEEENSKIESVSAETIAADPANFDALFDSLYSDVTGANNFISNLIEQKKTVNINEANLMEMQEKLEKDRDEFNKFVEVQKESIELEKAQCKEYVKTQKMRVANEEAQFNADVEATRAELALAEQTLKINNEKLADEKLQFTSYRELEEEKIKSDKQKLEAEKTAFAKEKSITEEKLKSDRLKLETEKEQFLKEKAISDDKLEADRQALDAEKEQFEKEKALQAEKLKNEQEELKKQEEQFAKFKELEEKKLELESKNLSQSCARFKELVSQFNSGFQQLPGERE